MTFFLEAGLERLLMAVPISQMWTVASYVLKQKIKGRKQYPFVLMLEPLFRCNLACAGCGKIQYPAHVLKSQRAAAQRKDSPVQAQQVSDIFCAHGWAARASRFFGLPGGWIREGG
jgi:hypothetical protein